MMFVIFNGNQDWHKELLKTLLFVPCLIKQNLFIYTDL